MATGVATIDRINVQHELHIDRIMYHYWHIDGCNIKHRMGHAFVIKLLHMRVPISSSIQ